MTPPLTPAERAAELYPLHTLSPKVSLNNITTTFNEIALKERAAYISGDAEGYARAEALCEELLAAVEALEGKRSSKNENAMFIDVRDFEWVKSHAVELRRALAAEKE